MNNYTLFCFQVEKEESIRTTAIKMDRIIEPFASEHLSSCVKETDFAACGGVIVRGYSFLMKQKEQEGIVFSFVLYYKKTCLIDSIKR